jgi:hypothetical protein
MEEQKPETETTKREVGKIEIIINGSPYPIRIIESKKDSKIFYNLDFDVAKVENHMKRIKTNYLINYCLLDSAQHYISDLATNLTRLEKEFQKQK